MPHLPLMQWNFKDELSATSRQVVNAGAPETTYYVYDAGGQRVRKITERQNGARKNERFYLGGFEIYREYGSGAGASLERETLHVMDDKQRIALVETQTIGNGAAGASNNLGATLSIGQSSRLREPGTGREGGLISYEEYSPYGSTTYQAGRSAAEVSLKRYRYTGKERDEENGFTYHGARYYAPWLGRWTSCDPAGLIDGSNLFQFCFGNPLKIVDSNGMQGQISKAGAPVGSSLVDAPELGLEISPQPKKPVVGKINDVEEPSLGGEISGNPSGQANPVATGPNNAHPQEQQAEANPAPAARDGSGSGDGQQQRLPSGTRSGGDSARPKQFISSQILSATSGSFASGTAAVNFVKNANPKTNASAPNALARQSNATGVQERRSFGSKVSGVLHDKLAPPPEKARWAIFGVIAASLLSLAALFVTGVVGHMVEGKLGNVIRLYALAIYLGIGLGRILVDYVFPWANKKFGWKLPENPPSGRDKPALDPWSLVHHLTGWMLGFFGAPLLFVIAVTILWEVFEWSGPKGVGDEESNANRATDLTLAWAGWALSRLVLH